METFHPTYKNEKVKNSSTVLHRKPKVQFKGREVPSKQEAPLMGEAFTRDLDEESSNQSIKDYADLKRWINQTRQEYFRQMVDILDIAPDFSPDFGDYNVIYEKVKHVTDKQCLDKKGRLSRMLLPNQVWMYTQAQKLSVNQTITQLVLSANGEKLLQLLDGLYNKNIKIAELQISATLICTLIEEARAITTTHQL